MYDEPGWLVQNHQRAVFVKNVERDRFWPKLQRFRPGNHQQDPVAWLDLLAGLGSLAVDRDPSLVDQPLEGGSGQRRVAVGQKQIEALRRLPGCDKKFSAYLSEGHLW